MSIPVFLLFVFEVCEHACQPRVTCDFRQSVQAGETFFSLRFSCCLLEIVCLLSRPEREILEAIKLARCFFDGFGPSSLFVVGEISSHVRFPRFFRVFRELPKSCSYLVLLVFEPACMPEKP